MTRDEYVRQVVAEAPPLTSEQRSQLYVLLAPARAALVAQQQPKARRRARRAA
jgi:hypothetical protein